MDNKFIQRLKNLPFKDEIKTLSEVILHRIPGEKNDIKQTFSIKLLDIILLDVSGSMGAHDYLPSRLEGAKNAAINFINKTLEIYPDTMVGIVAFSSSANVVCPPIQVVEGKKKLEHTIKNLIPLTTTNTASGLRLSGQAIKEYKRCSDARILLLTDGHANEGGNPEIVAHELKSDGIQLNIIGIGGSPSDVNEPQLKRMASVINDKLLYWFIKSVGELVRRLEVLALREIK